MKLKISIVQYQGTLPSYTQNFIFSQDGGSIGRSAENTWTLADTKKFLSRVQASIIFQNHKFYIIDKSSNGCYINYSDTPVGKGNSHELNDNDSISMGEYELRVNYINQNNPVDDTPFENMDRDTQNNQYKDPFITSEPGFSEKDPFDDIFQPNYTHENDYIQPEVDSSLHSASPIDMPLIEKEIPNSFRENNDSTSFSNLDKDDNLENSNLWLSKNKSSLDNPLSPFETTQREKTSSNNKIVTPTEKTTGYTEIFELKNNEPLKTEENLFSSQDKKINDLYNPENTSKGNIEEQKHDNQPDFTTESINNSDQPPSKSAQQENSLFEELFKSAGVTDIENYNTEFSKESAILLGKILHETLQGAMDLLRSRTATKDHMHLEDKTIISITQNNPLKFLPSANHVITQLILSKNNSNQAYMPLVDAIQESFNDLKFHQFALSMSIQEALSSTIRDYFSPDSLQKKLEKSNPLISKISWQKKAKLWKLFEETYENIEKEASETFQLVLEKKIADAYKANMKKLKQQNPTSH
jgi:type VI secretion system FHA domain protein